MRNWIPAVLSIALLAIILILFVGKHLPGSRAQPAHIEAPRERVNGVVGIQQPRSTPEEEKVDPAALNAAADYAAAHGSTALIVSRHGHLIFERYWGGTTRDTVVDAGGFARTVAAMLVGIALDDRHISSIEEPVGRFLDSLQGTRAQVSIREQLQDDDTRPLVRLTEKLSRKRYSAYLSRALWKPLSAGEAWIALDAPEGIARADCCFYARQGDWMRIAQLLLEDGVYEGSRILPQGWAARMTTPSARDPALGSQVELGTPRDGFYLAGAGESRLWLVPALHLAVLRLGTDPKDRDNGRIPQLVIAGVLDRPALPASTGPDISKLVPHH